MGSKALSDLTILDLTRVLAGPYCTAMLADYGANVIKIEVPGRGDDTRHMPPLKENGSLYFSNINRGKKGITLNLKAPEGKQMFKDMVKKADVVVENYRPGVMDKLGVGYDVLKEINPKIIYAAVSGFGCYGPNHQRPGYDIIAQATGGLMSITGQPGGHATRVGNAMGDVLGGMNLTIGILMAVHARSITGVGQRVDVALVDGVVSSLETGLQRFYVNGQPPLMGNRYAAAYPYDSFQAKDGLFVLACGNDKLWKLLCEKVLKKPELVEDPNYIHPVNRTEHWQELKPIIEDWSKDYTIDEAVETILAAGVPAAPINDLKRVTEDPHIAGAREMFVKIQDPDVGEIKVNGNPVKLMGTKYDISTPAPQLGQHNEEIYGELLGLTPEQLKELAEKKVI